MRRPVDPAALFRLRAHRWLAGAGRRLARARLLGQLAWLCQAEAEAILCSYCSPVYGPCKREHAPREEGEEGPKQRLADLTAEERAQLAHLRATGDAAAAECDRLAPGRVGPFADFIFGAAPGEP